ncbi:hypothetical protein [Marinobacter segnicrescens]|uniref:hypothetical protein n=1 Tax=Marinobacter segnicrescens TaxID=430453 RepID=UPI003A8D21DF
MKTLKPLWLMRLSIKSHDELAAQEIRSSDTLVLSFEIRGSLGPLSLRGIGAVYG